jgi:hypothetical protein
MARVVHGVGRIRFRLEYGGILEVDGILFVLGLRVNLLSVSALDDIGYSTLFKRYLCTGREWVRLNHNGLVIGWIGCTICEDNLHVMIQSRMRSRSLLRLRWAQRFSLAFQGKRGSLFSAPT